MKNKKNVLLFISVILIIIVICICAYFVIKQLNKKNTKNNNINIYSDSSTKNNTSTTDKKIVKVCEYNNPIVPQGFKKVETETASWNTDSNGIIKGWNNGLVIEDEIGNQFVWVPYDPSYTHLWKNIQIDKYGGFYIARYEAGIPESLKDRLENFSEYTNDIEGIPVSKKGRIPWNFISKENAKKNAESMYKDNQFVSSTLVSGEQRWDTMGWISSPDALNGGEKAHGNFSDANFKFTGLYSEDYGKNYEYGVNKDKAIVNMILATGIVERNRTDNIYDFLGNVAESYVYGTDSDLQSEVSGGYYDNSSIGWYTTFNHAWPNSKIGFRIKLCFKN